MSHLILVLFKRLCQVFVIAMLLSFLFKKDTDMSDYERELGKMQERHEDLRAANPGTVRLSHNLLYLFSYG